MLFTELDHDALRHSGRTTTWVHFAVHCLSLVLPALFIIAILYSPIVAPGHAFTAEQLGYLALQLLGGMIIVNGVHHWLYPQAERLVDRLHRWSLIGVLREWEGQRFKRAVKEIDRAIMNVDFSQALELAKIEPRLAEKQHVKIVLRQKRRLLARWISANPDRLDDVRHFLLLCIEAEKRRDRLLSQGTICARK